MSQLLKLYIMKSLQLFLFVSFFSFTCLAQTTDEFEDMANAKYDSKELLEALKLIKKSLDLDPTNIWKRIKFSDWLSEYGKGKEAVSELLKAIDIDNESPEPYNRLGNVFLDYNELDNALFYYGKAIEYAEHDSIRVNYLVNRATAKGVLRDYDGAIADFEAANKLDSMNLSLLNNLAVSYSEVGRIDDAVLALKKVASLDTLFSGSYVNLGMIYSEIDSLEQSEYYFDKAMALDPNEPLMLNNKGYLHYKKKEYATALKLINASLKLYPSNSYAYRNRALVYFSLNLELDACNDLAKAEKLDFKIRYGDEVERLIKERCNK